MKKIKFVVCLSLILFVGVAYSCRKDIYGLLFSQRYRDRLINNIHRYDFPCENNGWEKIGDMQVYGDPSTSSVFDPYVILERDTLVMYVSERLTNGIDRLTSVDGENWTKTGKALSKIPDTWQSIVNRATVVCKDSVWHMWYTGQYKNSAYIGHATSRDGRSFANASKPCLKPEFPTEGVSVMNPCVLWNETKQCFQMWYAAGENYEPDVLFYAESIDGENWTKIEQPVLSKLESHPWECAKIGGCDVKLREDGSYEMYYIGYQNVDVARICYATSTDGIAWNRSDNNLLIAPSKGRFDSDACYKPAVIETGG